MNKDAIIRIILIVLSGLIVAATLWHFYATKTQDQSGGEFTLKSASFENGQPMPNKYAYNKDECLGIGQNISPELHWEHVPEGTKSFALVVDDPDAPKKPSWIHWVMFNIPSNVTSLSEGGTFAYPQLANDFGSENKKYDGPCPPSGTHRYIFKLYALKEDIPLMHTHTSQRLKDYLEKNPDKNVLGTAELMGTYKAQ